MIFRICTSLRGIWSTLRGQTPVVGLKNLSLIHKTLKERALVKTLTILWRSRQSSLAKCQILPRCRDVQNYNKLFSNLHPNSCKIVTLCLNLLISPIRLEESQALQMLKEEVPENHPLIEVPLLKLINKLRESDKKDILFYNRLIKMQLQIHHMS